MFSASFMKLAPWWLLAISLPLGVRSYVVDLKQGLDANTTLPQRDVSNLSKRFSDVRFTWYDVETGNQVACGGYYHNNDAIVALSLATFNKAEHCGKGIDIHYGGKTVHATIVDGCEECPAWAIDLTHSLFEGLTTPGMVYGDWEFSDAAPAPAPPAPAPVPAPTTPPAPPPSQTTYKPAPTPTPTTTYQPAPKPTSSACVPRPTPSNIGNSTIVDGKKICRSGRPRQRRRKAQAAAAAQARAIAARAAIVERSEEEM